MTTKRFPFFGAAAVLSALVLCTGLLSAQPRERTSRHEADPGARLERMARFLELNESQQDELRAIFEAQRTTFEENRQAGRANRTALEQALETDAPDPATVGRLVIDGRNLREQAKADREALNEEIATVLTEEQLAKWEGFQRGRHFDERRGARRGPRGPKGSAR